VLYIYLKNREIFINKYTIFNIVTHKFAIYIKFILKRIINLKNYALFTFKQNINSFLDYIYIYSNWIYMYMYIYMYI